MTCIIGLVARSGDVYIGGDSSVQWGTNHRRVPNDLKVFRKGPLLIGCAGSVRYENVMRSKFEPPALEKDAYDYMCTDFVDAMRECLRDAGCMTIEANAERVDAACLVGCQGRLFCVSADFAVTENCEPDRLECEGSGGLYALGAAAALDSWPPEQRLLRALEISERFCTEVRAPFVVRRLPADGGDE